MARRIQNSTWLIAAAFFLVFAGFGSAQQFLAPAYRETGRQGLAVVSMFALYAAFALGGLAVPLALRRLSLRMAFVLPAATYPVFILMILLGNPVLLVASSALLGFGAAILWSSPASYIGRTVSEGARGENLSLPNAFSRLGTIAGTGLVTLLVPHLPFGAILLLLALFALAGTAAFFFLEEPDSYPAPLASPPFSLSGERRIFAVLAFAAFGYLVQGLLFSEFALFLHKSFGMQVMGAVALIGQVGFIAGSYAAGAVSDRIGRYRTLLIFSALYVAGAGLLFRQDSLYLFASGVTLTMVFAGACYPVVTAFLREIVPQANYGSALGLFQFASAGGAAAAMALCLLLGMDTIVPIVFATSLAGILLLVFLRKDLSPVYAHSM